MTTLINNDVLKANFKKIPPVNLVVTSPPYNVGIDYDTHADTMTYKEYIGWSKTWLERVYKTMADDGRLCINIPFSVTPQHLNKVDGAEDINYPVVADYTRICEEIGLNYWRTVVWEKNISNKTCWGSWRSASAPFLRDPSEAILIFYKGQWKRKTTGVSTIRGKEFMSLTKNVWKFNPETNSDHPAAFPPTLPDHCIKLLSYKGDVVMDPFMGSGTTGVSAVNLGRQFVGVEMSKEYFEGAKERIEIAEMIVSQSGLLWQEEEEADDFTESDAQQHLLANGEELF